MKTIKAIDAIINTDLQNKDGKYKTTAALNKWIRFLRDCILYLETRPSSEFIVSEIEKLEARSNLVENIIKDMEDSTYKLSQKKKQELKKSYNVGLVKLQLRTLRFLVR